MNAAHITNRIANAEAFRALEILRKALYNKNFKVSPLCYQKVLSFAQQIVGEGALFLLGMNSGEMVMNRYRALSTLGFADIAEIAGTLATLIAATIKRDRAQAFVSARSFNGKPAQVRIVRLMIEELAAPANVIPFRRAA